MAGRALDNPIRHCASRLAIHGYIYVRQPRTSPNSKNFIEYAWPGGVAFQVVSEYSRIFLCGGC